MVGKREDDINIDNLIMAEQMIRRCNIPNKYKYVICARYFYGKLLRELAGELGVTPSRIRYMESEALRRLRKIAFRDYFDNRI